MTASPTTQALDMLAAFASVGATAFDITHTNIDGEKRGFRPRQSLAETRRSMPYLMESAPRRQNNIIVRPEPSKRFIQLDDLGAEGIERVRPAAFLILATSPGNFQAWLAVDGLKPEEHKEYSGRVRRGAGADVSASGATRVAGSANYKHKYAPNFPTVAVLESAPGRTTTPAELEALGIVAPPEPKPAPVANPPRQVSGRGRIGPRKWPSYARCVQGAPAGKNNGGKPDRSMADFVWCMTAIDWGFSLEATAAQLLRESDRARQQGEGYARATAENAQAAIDRRTSEQPHPGRSTPRPQI